MVWEREDGMVRFAHHTVQQFLLSDPFSAQRNDLKFSEHEAENHIGEMCLTYLLFSDFETQVQTRPAHIQPQQPLDVPQVGPAYWIPEMLGVRASKIDQPLRLLGLKSTSSSPQPPDYAEHLRSAFRIKVSTPSTEIVEKYALLQYIIDNWVSHTGGFEPSSTSCRKLQDLAMYKTLPFEFRPWGRNQLYGPYGCGSCKPGGISSSEAERLPFMSLLHYGAENGNSLLMEPLIEEYCSHETKDPKSRDFVWDANDDHWLLAKPVFEKGRHTLERNDWTICIAIYNGHSSIFEHLFMRCGMDISAAAYTKILNAAANSGGRTVFETLIRHLGRRWRSGLYARDYVHTTGALAAANGHQAMLEIIFREFRDIWLDKRVDRHGETAISAAAANGHVQVVLFLIAKGARLATKGVTPLHRAAENGHMDVAHTLLKVGQDRAMAHLPSVLHPPQLVGVLDSEGETPIQRAARNGHADVVQLMFEYVPLSKDKWLLATATETAEFREFIKEGTALYLAAANGHIAVVKLFYAHMDDDGTQGHKANAFLAAAKGNHIELVQWLLENGDGTEDQSDALRVAVGKGYQHLAHLFLNQFPELVTPELLLLAAKNGHEEILEYLISTHEEGGMYIYQDTTKKLLVKAYKKAKAAQLEKAARLLKYYWTKGI